MLLSLSLSLSLCVCVCVSQNLWSGPSSSNCWFEAVSLHLDLGLYQQLGL